MNEWTTSRVPWVLKKRMLVRLFEDVVKELAPGDTVWIHNRPEFAAALGARIRERGARVVLHMHNSHLAQWMMRGQPMPEADRYVFVSRYLEQEARESGMAAERVEILNNGADESIFYPAGKTSAAREAPVVVFAGRLIPEKGVHVFLEAMAGLWREGIGLQGVVIGSGGFGEKKPSAYVKALKAMAPPSVTFSGYCSGAELGERFRDADMFCLPACWHDPFPLAVLEAMASGLPVVATRSGGIPEELCDGGGLMVQRDSVFELQTALMYLAGDADRRKELGAQAYASFQKNFTWQSVRDRYGEILSRLWADGLASDGLLPARRASAAGGVAMKPQEGVLHAGSH